MIYSKTNLDIFNATRTTAHEILFYDDAKTLIFAKCEATDEPKTFPFEVPANSHWIPLVFSRTLYGEIEFYSEGESEYLGKHTDPEYQDDGFGTSAIPTGKYVVVVHPNTLQYCVSTNNKSHRIEAHLSKVLEANEEYIPLDVHAYYLCIYGKAIVDGVEVEDVMLEPNCYSNILATDAGAHFSQVRITVIDTGDSLDLSEAKELKIKELDLGCSTSIKAGFTSDALGTPHEYQSGNYDQLNLVGAAMSYKDRIFNCSPVGTDLWEYKTHKQSQIQAVLEDGITTKEKHLYLCDQLKKQAVAATTAGQLETITWG